MVTKRPKQAIARKSTGCRRNAQTSRSILDAAAALLQEKGYANFTIEEVARRAGASKSTIYRWWSSKMHLLLDIYGGDVEKMIEIPDFGSIEAEIIFLNRAIWKIWRETPSGQAFKSMIAELQGDPAAFEHWRSRFLPERRRKLLFTLQRAADRGELRPDIQLETVVDILFGYSWYRLLTGQIDDDVEVISSMVHEIVQGISLKSAFPAEPV
ncbi:MAG: TetR/AcrR family transcriptional regulator [Deltaproteobacteria bacterium]|nr:TetR/AcrR family transcriptional regulator [Deltaproteobacteria bacterium]